MLPQQRNTLRWTAAVAGVVLVGMVCWQRTRQIAAPSRPVTFTRDVAPMVFAKCATCHHPGESAPFSLLTYDDVRGRASQIVDVTQKRFMPPWLPTEGHGDFVGSRRLTARELQIFQEWADAGAPRGEEADMPAAPDFTDGWQSRPPDLVLESPAFTLASQSRDVFRNFVVPITLNSPRWVQSIELRPDNPRVTHHARLGVDSSHESLRRDVEDAEPGYDGMAWGQDPEGQLVIWAPGMVASPPSPGVAWRLFPKSILVLHTHLQPSGKSEVLKFRIGIRFASEPPQHHPVMMRIGSCDIDIPAGAIHHTVTDHYILPIDVDVQTIFPHAHSLCRELSVIAERPDGLREPLIAISQFDENWHDSYRYRQPVRLPRGTRIHSTFIYDNSEGNIRNRNRPPRRVVYGSHATDEMADIYLQVTPVRVDQRAVLMEHYKIYELQSLSTGYRKSLEVNPGDPWSQEGLAACHMGQGEPRKAIAILEQRLKTGRSAVFPIVSLGMALTSSGEPARAEQQLRRALAIDDKYPLAWLGLGNALAAQQKLEPAEQAWRRAVALAPGYVDALLNLADLLMRRGQLEQAAGHCAAALKDSPEMANLHLKFAEIRARQKKYEESLLHCEIARRLAPYTHPGKVLLAVYCFANSEPDRGVKYLQEARVESPHHPMPSLMLGQLARRQQQGQAARELFEAALTRPIPDNWPESHKKRFLVSLHSERYYLAQQLKDAKLARDAITQWMQSDPNNAQVLKMYNDLPASPP